MTKEDTFWARILELSQEQLKQTTYDFFVSEAKLIGVENQEATILLDSPVKQLFWEQNLANIVLTAGFEIYYNQISIRYTFDEAEKKTSSASLTSPQSNLTSSKAKLPQIETVTTTLSPLCTLAHLAAW